MVFLYTYFIAPILWLLFKIGALFFSEFKKRESIISVFSHHKIEKLPKKKVFWVHAASMGEFEQAKPIIEYVREIEKDNITIIVTFFSPSGYEHQKNYPYADRITYLPVDTFGTMEQFVAQLEPTIVLFIRYEIWPNLLLVLAQKSIPYYFVNATYPHSWFWDSIGKSFLKQLLTNAEGIYSVNEQMYSKFIKLVSTKNVHQSADTRIDRIVEKVHSHQAEEWYIIPKKPVLILGSSWEAEENLLSSVSTSIKEKFHIIIVPHKPETVNLHRLQSLFQDSYLLSQIDQNSSLNNEVVIVDSVGKLLSLYSKATVALVGGGFGRCVHSTAEAIAYGIPVLCGPNISKSPDAPEFERRGLVTILRTKEDLEKVLLKVLEDKKWLQFIRTQSELVLQSSIGESKRIGDIIRNFLH